MSKQEASGCRILNDFGFPSPKSYPAGTFSGRQLLRVGGHPLSVLGPRGDTLMLRICVIRREDLEKFRECRTNVAFCFLANSGAEREDGGKYSEAVKG